MAGTIQLGGLASGLDTDGIISKLVGAASGNLSQIRTKASQLKAASTTMSDLGKALSTLKSATTALASIQDVASFAATSTSTAIGVAANGDAQPGAYQIEVTRLAAAQRTYSATFATDVALGQTGSFTITLGGTTKTIDVVATDKLSDIASKINASGLRVSSSVFNDGTKSRLQIRGLDTGVANALTFVENGTTLDLNGTGGTPDSGKTVQAAEDALVKIDGFTVTRGTNQITGAIQGVTLTLKELTTAPATVTVASDPAAVITKISAVVTAYNAVVSAAHAAAGFGSQKATNPELSGDSTIRMLTDRLSSTILGKYATGQYETLGGIGVKLTRDGTLSFDQTKFNSAVAADPTAVQKVLGRATGATTGGAMATLGDLATTLTTSSTGTLALRQTALSSQASKLDDRALTEQARLERYADTLRKQFGTMETSYAASQQLLTQLSRQFG